MASLIWLIAGIVMLAITLFVHKHTSDLVGNKLPLPLWGFLAGGIIAGVPIVNLLVFSLGVIIYFNLLGDCIKFSCKATWYKRLIDLLTYDLNKR